MSNVKKINGYNIKDEIARQMLDDTTGSIGRTHPTVLLASVTTDSAGAFTYKNGNSELTTANCRAIMPLVVGTAYYTADAFFNSSNQWRGYIKNATNGQAAINSNFNVLFLAWLT